jgi:DNA repair protein RadC
MGVKIKDIPSFDRPRERLINNGVESLSNEELLAIIFKTGAKGISAKDLGSLLLSKVDNIKKLNDINYEFLKNIKGIGMSKACDLIAAIELGKRINREIDTIKNIRLTSADLVYKYYKEKLGDKKQEYFYAIYLDNGKKIIGDKLLFIGTVNYSLVHPREIFKEAYLLGASALICIHNHPGGNPLPSSQDFEITNNLIEVSKILGIKFLDHIIICKNNYYSFLENNDIHF